MKVEGRTRFILAMAILLVLFGACKSETQEKADKKTEEKAPLPLEISDIKSSAEEVRTGESATLYVDISNPGGLSLTFEWKTDKGTLDPPSGSTQVTYHAPTTAGSATVSLTVKNSTTGAIIATKNYRLPIVSPPLPQISEIMGGRAQMKVGESVELYVDVLSHPSNTDLAFEWRASRGRIAPPSGSDRVTYHAPEARGSETISLIVKNRTTGESVTTKTLQLQIIPRPTPVDVIADFVFAGYMGDGERPGPIQINDGYTGDSHSPPSCVKVTYRIPSSSVGWAGVYAQYNVRGPGNWGERPGRDLTGYTQLVWYAKGERGGEMVEFKAGGIDAPGKPYRDSFEKSLGTARLDTQWTRYELDLTGQNLSSVIGGFCWVAKAGQNPNGLTFYIDSITYE